MATRRGVLAAVAFVPAAVTRALVFLIVVILIVGGYVKAGSIFDDDWAPPRAEPTRSVSPPLAATAPDSQPVRPAQETANENPPQVTPPQNSNTTVALAAPQQSTARLPVPQKSELSSSRTALRQAYARELADPSPEARRALAVRLLADAEKAQPNPPDQFALLSGAVEAANQGGDLRLSFQVADEMGRHFDIDPLSLESDDIAKAVRLPDPETLLSNCQAGTELIRRLVTAEEFPQAIRLGATVTRTAPSAGWRQAVARAVQDAEAARVACDVARLNERELKKAPNDKNANLIVGKYLCFFRNDWPAGLAKLGAGSDGTIAALALRDLGNPATADAQGALADAWWDFAQQHRGAVKDNIESRASLWYRKVIPEASPLKKTLYVQRIDAAERATNPPAFSMYRFGDETHLRIIPLTDTAFPDDLTIEVEPGSILVSGTKKSDTVGGLGWFGKAAMVEATSGSGTLRVSPTVNHSGPTYKILLQDLDGRVHTKDIDLRQDVVYTWSVSPSDGNDEIVFEVTGSNDTGPGLRVPLGSMKAYGFGALGRYPRSRVSMAVTLE